MIMEDYKHEYWFDRHNMEGKVEAKRRLYNSPWQDREEASEVGGGEEEEEEEKTTREFYVPK